MANEVVDRTAGRIRITDNLTLQRACESASVTGEPIEIVGYSYQLLGYIVSKEYIRSLKSAAKP